MIGCSGVDADTVFPGSGGLAEILSVGKVEEDGTATVHQFGDAAGSLVGAQGEVGREGTGQGVLVGVGSG